MDALAPPNDSREGITKNAIFSRWFEVTIGFHGIILKIPGRGVLGRNQDITVPSPAADPECDTVDTASAWMSSQVNHRREAAIFLDAIRVGDSACIVIFPILWKVDDGLFWMIAIFPYYGAEHLETRINGPNSILSFLRWGKNNDVLLDLFGTILCQQRLLCISIWNRSKRFEIEAEKFSPVCRSDHGPVAYLSQYSAGKEEDGHKARN